MGRPHLELGTHGRVRVYPDAAGYRAVCLYRDWDGVTRQVQRQAKTKGAAERALALTLRDRGRSAAGGEITPDTKMSVLSEKWFSELAGKSPSTMQAYRDRLDRQVLPALGNVRVREITVGLLDRHLAAVRASHGPALAMMTKSVERRREGSPAGSTSARRVFRRATADPPGAGAPGGHCARRRGRGISGTADPGADGGSAKTAARA